MGLMSQSLYEVLPPAVSGHGLRQAMELQPPPGLEFFTATQHARARRACTAFTCNDGPVPSSTCDKSTPCPLNQNCKDGQCHCDNTFCQLGNTCVAKGCLGEAEKVQKSIDKLEGEVAQLAVESGSGENEQESADLQASGLGGGSNSAMIKKLEEKYAKYINLPHSNQRVEDVISELKRALKAQLAVSEAPDAKDMKPGVETIIAQSGDSGIGAAAKDFSAASQDLVEKVNSKLRPDRIALMTSQDIPELLRDTVAEMNNVDQVVTSLRQKLAVVTELSNAELTHNSAPEPAHSLFDSPRPVLANAIAQIPTGPSRRRPSNMPSDAGDENSNSTAAIVRRVIDELRGLQPPNPPPPATTTTRGGIGLQGFADAGLAPAFGAGVASVLGAVTSNSQTSIAIAGPAATTTASISPSIRRHDILGISKQRHMFLSSVVKSPSVVRTAQPWSQRQRSAAMDFF